MDSLATLVCHDRLPIRGIGTGRLYQWLSYFLTATYYAPNSGGTQELAYDYLEKLTGGKIDIWMYTQVPNSPEAFTASYDKARALGAKHILFWEADYIDNFANKAEIQKAMTERAWMPAK
jgi:hypothetical protein